MGVNFHWSVFGSYYLDHIQLQYPKLQMRQQEEKRRLQEAAAAAAARTQQQDDNDTVMSIVVDDEGDGSGMLLPLQPLLLHNNIVKQEHLNIAMEAQVLGRPLPVAMAAITTIWTTRTATRLLH